MRITIHEEHERIILEKINIYADKIMQFKKGMTFEEFSDDPKTIGH